jgi:hypothetical protein
MGDDQRLSGLNCDSVKKRSAAEIGKYVLDDIELAHRHPAADQENVERQALLKERSLRFGGVFGNPETSDVDTDTAAGRDEEV